MWRDLLGTAIHTPSPHNVQPWRIRIISESEAELFIEKRRTLPKEDVTGSFIILTMGLFVEALRILARNRSLNLEYELYDDPSQFTAEIIGRTENELLPFARLRLDAHERGPVFYPDEVFLKRRTSRISLSPRAVPDAATTSLAKIASQWGRRYQQITDRDL